MTIQIGIGSADLWGAWPTTATLDDELRVQALVAADADGIIGAILGSDFMLMWPESALELRRRVAASLDIDAGRVGVFCTQNHGGPAVGRMDNYASDIDAIAERVVAAVRAARDSVAPAHMAIVNVEPSPPGLLRRRKAWGDCGEFTFWYGYDVTADGRADGGTLLRQALAGLRQCDDPVGKYPGAFDSLDHSQPMPAAEVPDSLIMDDEADTLLQGLFFRTPEGEPIGALARWAAHPATATGLTGGTGGDYPVYLRRRLASEFGGEALFLTGPCGDQVAPVGEKSVAVAERTGSWAADQLLDGLGAATWSPVRVADAVSVNWTLPLRDDIPSAPETCKQAHADAIAELGRRRAADASLAELKRLADRVEALGYWANGNTHAWTGLKFADLAEGQYEHPSFAMRFDDAVVLGLPGEPVGGYSRALRRGCADISLLTSEECNGYLSYIPMAADCPQGGYEVCAAPFGAAVEPALLGQANALARSLFPVTGDDVGSALTELGIAVGDALMVHASMKALGQVEGGPEAIVRALLDQLGPAGTLVAPTFPADFFWGDLDQVWDRDNTPSAMGVVTETIRTWPGAVRTRHASHPLAAIGPAASALGECRNIRDYDETSPFQILLDLNAWIVLLGVDFDRCTFIHMAEERERVPYRYWQTLYGTVIDDGVSRQRELETYKRTEPAINDFLTCGRDLEAAGLVRKARLGMGTVRAIRAKDLMAFIAERLRADPLYLLTAETRPPFERP